MIKFLEESEGNKSTMRAISVVLTIAACFFGYLTISLESEMGLWVTMSFLSVAVGGKVTQKMFEVKNDKSAQNIP